MQNFRALGADPVPPVVGGFTPKPPCLRRLGALPPNPQPPAAGGFAPRPPLASSGWGLRPQTPKTALPHCEFLATRLIVIAMINGEIIAMANRFHWCVFVIVIGLIDVIKPAMAEPF